MKPLLEPKLCIFLQWVTDRSRLGVRLLDIVLKVKGVGSQEGNT